MRTISIDFDLCRTYDFGVTGEHNQTVIDFILPEDLCNCDFVNAEYAKPTGIKYTHEALEIDNGIARDTIPQQLTDCQTLEVQLVGYVVDEAGNNMIIGKSPIITGTFKKAVAGIEAEINKEPTLIQRLWGKLNSLWENRHSHSNKSIIDALDKQGDALTFSGKPIGSANIVTSLPLIASNGDYCLLAAPNMIYPDDQHGFIKTGNLSRLKLPDDVHEIYICIEVRNVHSDTHSGGTNIIAISASESDDGILIQVEVCGIDGTYYIEIWNGVWQIAEKYSYSGLGTETLNELPDIIRLALFDGDPSIYGTLYYQKTIVSLDNDYMLNWLAGNDIVFFSSTPKLYGYFDGWKKLNSTAYHAHNNHDTLSGLSGSERLSYRGDRLRTATEGADITSVSRVNANGRDYLRVYLSTDAYNPSLPQYLDIPIADVVQSQAIDKGVTLNGTELVLPEANLPDIINRLTADGDNILFDGKMLAGVCLIVNSTNSTQPLFPNTEYRFGEVDALTITLVENESDISNEYYFDFISGNNPTVLTMPTSIRFQQEIEIKPNKHYQVSIMNGIALWCSAEV